MTAVYLVVQDSLLSYLDHPSGCFRRSSMVPDCLFICLYRVFRNYSTPLQGVREQLISIDIWFAYLWICRSHNKVFKLFFFLTKCLYTFICIYFNEYLPWEKFTSNQIFIGNLKRKNSFKQFFVFTFSSEVICKNLAIFIKIF